MPAHKKTNLQLVSTSIKHNAGRYAERIDGASADDRPLEMPRQDLLTFATAWATIIEMCPPGVLRKSDTLIVERAARVLMNLRNRDVMTDVQGSSIPELDPRIEKLFESLMARLGASPADRGKVVIPKQEQVNNDFD